MAATAAVAMANANTHDKKAVRIIIFLSVELSHGCL